MKMASRKGKRSSIENVLDDLLASDDEGSRKRKSSTANKTTPTADVRKNSQVKLTSNTSDAEFYKNLQKISGNDGFHQDDDESEEEDLSDNAARKLAENIGDLDDLDNDLFAGLNQRGTKKAKPEQKRETKPFKRSSKKSSKIDNYDLDDPLAGLGLSDDEELGVKKSFKSAPPKKPLSRRLSNERKVEPNGSKTDHFRHDLDPNNDPFLSSDAKEGKITTTAASKQSSFDDFTASESETSPRRQQQKESQLKNRRHKSNRKSLVEPTMPDNVFEKEANKKDGSKVNPAPRGRQRSTTTDESDLFDDSDGLPGLSDEESKPIATSSKSANTNNQRKQPGRKTAADLNIDFDDDEDDDDDIPNEKATSALDNLLGGGNVDDKKKQPTMLDQIMSSKGKKASDKISANVKKENDNDLLFGGYAPSVSGNDRPTTAPDRRSVRFADELGLDLNDDSVDSRPSTALAKKKTGASSDFFLDSSLDEHDGKNFFNKVRQKSIAQTQKGEESEPKTKKDMKNAKQSSKDDWLGLGEDHTDQLDLLSSGELFSPRNKPSISTQSRKPVTESPLADGDKKYEKTDDLELPWESPSTKRRSGRREFNEVISAPQDKSQDHISSPRTASLKQPEETNQNLYKSEDDKIAEDNFVSLLKNGKNSTISKRGTDSNSKDAQNQAKQQQQQQREQQQLLLQQQQQQQMLQQKQFLLSPREQYDNLLPVYDSFSIPQPQTLQPSSLSVQQLRNELQKDISMKHQEEFNASKRQFERDKSYLESEIRDLQEKVLKLNESRDTTTTDYSGKVRELEAKVSRLEMERDNLLMSIESLKQRHKDEMTALEISHKNRLGYIEESYKRREQQIRDENIMMASHFEEKEKAMRDEQNDLITGNKKKCELLERNQTAEMNRLKELHKKSLEEFLKEHKEQISHMRMVKEQEVDAAVSAFSHAKSLQSLMQEVQNSTRELGNLQMKIDASHSTKLEERELSLKTRDQYLKNLENKLHTQETTNEEERQCLQNLVLKLEVQLREQTRQIEQDKWKMTKDDNRLKAMQLAFEEERRITSEQLTNERNQLAKAREEMLIEQRRIIAECYEEKRRVTDEKNKFAIFQRESLDQTRKDRSSALQAESELEVTLNRYEHEASTVGVRIAQIKQKEDQLVCQKEEFVHQKTCLDQEYERLREASKSVQKRSEEIEKFAQEATQIQHDAERAMEEAYVIKTEFLDANQELDAKAFSLQQQERSLSQERVKLRDIQRELEADRRSNVCAVCKNTLIHQNSHLPAPLYNLNPHSERYPYKAIPLFNTNPLQLNESSQKNNHGYNFENTANEATLPPAMVVSEMGGLDLRSSTPASASHTKQQFHSTYKNKSVVASPAVVPQFDQLSKVDQLSQVNSVPTIGDRYKGTVDDLSTTYSLPDKNNNKKTPVQTLIPKLEFEDFSVDSLISYQAPAQNGKSLHAEPTGINDFNYSSPSQPVIEPLVTHPPPDLIMNNMEFKRTIRRWNTAKDKDDDFFEEEQRFLKTLQARRTR